MADNNAAKATPLIVDQGEPTHKMRCSQKWDEIKADAFQIYMKEDNDLTVTMAKIGEIHGFKASRRTWKYKTGEWGWNKNIPKCDMQWIIARGTKRAQEGKDTEFSYRGTPVTAQKIENFKKRKTGEVPDSIPTPPNVTYNTPSNLDSERDTIEEYPGAISYNSPPSLRSSCSMNLASLVGPLCSLDGNVPIAATEPLEKSLVKSVLDEYLSNKEDPWSPFSMYRLGNPSPLLAMMHMQKVEQDLELKAPPAEQLSQADLCGIGGQFVIGSGSTIEWEQEDSSDTLVLDDAFGVSLTLSKYQHQQDCTIFEIINSAKHMYQVLFKHSSHADPFLYEHVEGIAPLKHGLLLRREGRWTSHAERLLQACKSAMDSGTHDSQLIRQLGNDFINLLWDLDNKSNENVSRVQSIRRVLNHGIDPDTQRTDRLKATIDALTEEYLLADNPNSFMRPRYHMDVTQFGWLSGAADPIHTDNDHSSTGSLSTGVSHRHGLTYSSGEISGISDSIFMAC